MSNKFLFLFLIFSFPLTFIFSQSNLPWEYSNLKKNYVPESRNTNDINKPGSNNYLEYLSSFSYGSALAVSIDSLRNVLFLGSGGGVLIFDVMDKTNPVLLTNMIRTQGVVMDIFYDETTKRIYLACGEGGLEIWDVQTPTQPVLLSRTEVLFFDVETPVGHVQVKNNFAYCECGFGYVQSLNCNDPYNPYQISYDNSMGNPAYDIFISSDGSLFASGFDNYLRYSINAGQFAITGYSYFVTSIGPMYATPDYSFVGRGTNMYILDMHNGTFPVISQTDVGGITHIEMRNNLAYIVNGSVMQVWNVSNVQNPSFRGSTPLPGASEDMTVADNYAYVADGAAGLIIYDVSNPQNPVETANYQTLSQALDVFIQNNYVYLADNQSGMVIINDSNINYPTLAGHYMIPSGYMYDAKVQDNIAYTVGYASGLRIANISDTSNIIELFADTTFNSFKLELNGNYLYVAQINSAQSSVIRIYDISDPSNPNEINDIVLPSIVEDLTYYSGYLYVSNYTNGLLIYDVSDPSNPVETFSINYPDVFDVEIYNGYAYVCALDNISNNGGLHILNVSNPAQPVEVGYYSATGFYAIKVKVAGDYAYVADGDELHLVYVQDKSNPVLLEDYALPGFAHDLYAKDSLIFIADEDAGLQILENKQFNSSGGNLNWHQQNVNTAEGAGLNSIYFKDVNTGWTVGDLGSYSRTTDGGQNWTQLDLSTSSNLNKIEFINGTTGWIVGSGGLILKTTNAGITWNAQSSGTSYTLYSASFVSENEGWISGDNGIILHTSNGGSLWQIQNSSYSAPIMAIDFLDSQNGLAAASGDIGAILRTANGGATWQLISTSAPYFLFNVDFVSENVAYAVGMFGAIVKSLNGGLSWFLIPDPPPHDWLYGLDFLDEQNGWIVGFDGKVIHTTDGGNSWDVQTSGVMSEFHSVSFINESNGWAAGLDFENGGHGVIINYSVQNVPVELVNFSANIVGKKVELNWQTVSEKNNKGFEIERKDAGGKGQYNLWKKIGFVEGTGTSSKLHSYKFSDDPDVKGTKTIYQYRLKQIDLDGSFRYSETIVAEISIPSEFTLEQNYPNPFNPSTTIKYSIPKSSNVTLKIFDVLGREIETLVNEAKKAGTYEAVFDASEFASGIYFYKLQAGSFIETKEMLLLK